MAGTPPKVGPVTVPGGTRLAEEKSTGLAERVIALVKGGKMEEACSLLIDLWLEDSTDKKLNLVLGLLEEGAGEDLARKLRTQYLDPSIAVMTQIRRSSVVAERYDYEVAVRSSERLALFGLSFSPGEGKTIRVDFRPSVTATVNGRPLAGTDGLSLDDRTAKVRIVETDAGFELHAINRDGSRDVATFQVPKEVPGQPPARSRPPSSYTPGTRYAVICREDLPS